eukprot:764820-Hanusia_phi.AAC.5
MGNDGEESRKLEQGSRAALEGAQGESEEYVCPAGPCEHRGEEGGGGGEKAVTLESVGARKYGGSERTLRAGHRNQSRGRRYLPGVRHAACPHGEEDAGLCSSPSSPIPSLPLFCLLISCLTLRQAREMFKRGCTEAKKHAALWQAWALHEVRERGCGERLRVSAAGEEQCERSAKYLPARSVNACLLLLSPSFPSLLYHPSLISSSSGLSPPLPPLRHLILVWTLPSSTTPPSPSPQSWGLMEAAEGNLDEARKYFARAVDVADRPAPSLAAWAKVEEEAGNLIESRWKFSLSSLSILSSCFFFVSPPPSSLLSSLSPPTSPFVSSLSTRPSSLDSSFRFDSPSQLLTDVHRELLEKALAIEPSNEYAWDVSLNVLLLSSSSHLF